LISRVADHCFWFGRYLERAESTARVLSVTRNLALDAELSPRQCWRPLLIVDGEEPSFLKSHGPDAADDGELVQEYLTWARENASCIRHSVRAARENARSIREVVSLEAWEATNELYLWLASEEARDTYAEHRDGFYRRVRQSVQLALGLLRSTMLHDTPLDFIWLGVLLERVGQTARTLDVHHHALTRLESPHQVVETALWLSLLRACSGFEPFMKRYQGKVTGHQVAVFLILEPRFPRSVRYCVHSAYERLCEIRPPAEHELPGGRSQERLRVLDAWLAEKTPASLAGDATHDVLTHVVDEVHAICDEVGQEFLGVAPPAEGGEVQARRQEEHA
jgi:uncharacterized alpha-E superfamily protein